MALEKQETRYVVDTDLIINHLRKAADLAAILNPLAKDDAAFLVSSVTIAEVFAGKSSQDKKELEVIEKMFSVFEIIDVTGMIAQKGGEYARDYAVPLLDALIAATAFESGAVIITKNTKHFKKIPTVVLYNFAF
ncbi:MAG: type II toxin-antitoxin system VapC family toxin [Candidatus Jacksonbacteria bacterium]|nr:type II toxin-antitoxin system VapC family toxin [Candidatus Jacksonbacteria bacterium]